MIRLFSFLFFWITILTFELFPICVLYATPSRMVVGEKKSSLLYLPLYTFGLGPLIKETL